MPRKIRVQYPGAMYHIMSRGNQYQAVFLSDHDRDTFIKTLGEVCEKTGWIIHAYVLMSNHYHWLLETPEANLIDGMRWFQSTYTKRFNSRNKLVGHLFQGRYRSLLIDPESNDHFLTVSNYIHLNPARAGLLDKKNPNLNQYKWNSYRSYIQTPGKRPVWLHVERTFKSLNILKDNAAGRKNYSHYMELALLEVLNPKKIKQFEEQWNRIRQGWYLGEDNFKERMLKYTNKVLKGKKEESYSGEQLREHTETTAGELISKALKILGIKESDLSGVKKNDPRKQVIAWLIKSKTTVKNQWIADRLCMGHWANVTKAVSQVRDGKIRGITKLSEKVKKTV